MVERRTPEISASQQLPLAQLSLREAVRFSSWYESPSSELVSSHLKDQLLNPKEHAQIFLWGTAETGKTHLLQASCTEVADSGQRAGYFPLKEVQNVGPAILMGSERFDVLCMDDVDQIVGHPEWEQAQFKMINLARETQQRLIMSASANPRDIECKLKDLQSRLPWGTNFQLLALEDDEKAELLCFRARQRGLEISDDVVDYIWRRYPRNLKSLIEILNQLDEASLSTNRRITVPFVKEVL